MDAIMAFITAHMELITMAGGAIVEVADRLMPTKQPSGLIYRVSRLLAAIGQALDSVVPNNVKNPPAGQ